MTPQRFRKLNAVLDRRQPDLTVVSEDVHKTHNVSALLRSCDAAGVFRMHAVSPEQELRAHRRMAGGSWRWVKVTRHSHIADALEQLKESNFQIFAAHPSDQSEDYRRVDYTPPTAIVLGAELTGVSTSALELADQLVKIPMHGMVSSLNVSVASALMLFEAARQRTAAGLYESSRLPQKERENTLFEWCYPDIARRCRERGLDYPALDGDGLLQENPFRIDTADRTSDAVS